MAFTFGGLRSNVKATTVKNIEDVDPIVENNIQPNSQFVVFLLDDIPTPLEKVQLKKYISGAGITSYLIASALKCKFDPEAKEIIKYYIANRSNWTKFLKLSGCECIGVMTFGRALYSVTQSMDVEVDGFLPSDFIDSYFYIGHGNCGNYDCHFVPVYGLKDIFPVVSQGPNVTWRTRFFKKQLEVLKKADKVVPDQTPYNIHLLKTPEEAKELFDQHMGAKYVAFDTETTGLDMVYDRVFCLTITWDGVNGYFLPWDIIDYRQLADCLESCEHRITQNGKFDIKMMWASGMPAEIETCPTDDTMQLAHAIHSEKKRGLKSLAFLYTPFGGYDLALDRFKTESGVTDYSKIPFDILSQYAVIDAIVTYRVFFALYRVMQQLDSQVPNDKMPEWTIERWYNEIMMPVYPDFIEMEYRGMWVSRDNQHKGQQILLKQLEDCKEAMAKTWNVDKSFDFASTKKLGKLFQDMGWPPVELGKDGIYSTKDDVLIEYGRLGKPGIKELQLFRTTSKFLQSYLGMEDGDDAGWNKFIREENGEYKIHCNFLVNGTTSYRNICSAPNLQQIPVHDKNAKYVQQMVSVPPLTEYRVTLDDQSYHVGLDDDKIDGTSTFFGEVQEGSTLSDGRIVVKLETERSQKIGEKHFRLCTADFSSLQCRLVTIDTKLNDSGIDKNLYDVYREGGMGDMHSMTGFNSFVKALNKQVLDVVDDDGNNWVFFEDQRMNISREGKEMEVLGKDVKPTDTIVGYVNFVV